MDSQRSRTRAGPGMLQVAAEAELKALSDLIRERNNTFTWLNRRGLAINEERMQQLFRLEVPARVVFNWDDKVVWLTDVALPLPNGKTRRREVEVRDNGVIVVTVLPDGKLGFVKPYREPAERSSLEFPGGGIQKGEEPRDAVRKELLEESGYTVFGEPIPLGYTYPHMYGTSEIHFIYVVNVVGPRQEQHLDSDEIIAKEITPLTLREAIDAKYSQQIVHEATVAALGMYVDFLGLTRDV